MWCWLTSIGKAYEDVYPTCHLAGFFIWICIVWTDTSIKCVLFLFVLLVARVHAGCDKQARPGYDGCCSSWHNDLHAQSRMGQAAEPEVSARREPECAILNCRWPCREGYGDN